jgi:hypothetical protein
MEASLFSLALGKEKAAGFSANHLNNLPAGYGFAPL